jgi:hypothetical protein
VVVIAAEDFNRLKGEWTGERLIAALRAFGDWFPPRPEREETPKRSAITGEPILLADDPAASGLVQAALVSVKSTWTAS